MAERVTVSEPAMPLTRDLLHYWIQHPGAQGTVESIVEWWLLEHRIQRAVLEVKFVLAELVKENFVLERRQADGRDRYELNREREKEIRAWLAAAIREAGSRDKGIAP